MNFVNVNLPVLEIVVAWFYMNYWPHLTNEPNETRSRKAMFQETTWNSNDDKNYQADFLL